MDTLNTEEQVKPRDPPTATFEGLQPPEVDFRFFQHADRRPFDPAERDRSAVNAWWLADASLLSYGDSSFIEARFAESPLPSLGYTLGWLGTCEENRGFVLRSDRTLLVILRGTRVRKTSVLDLADLFLLNQDDLITDSQFVRQPCDAGGKVHRGFLSAYLEVEADIDKLVQDRAPGQGVWIAGHSLGGALAMLAAAHLPAESVAGVYTFGAPRVGNAEFISCLPRQRVHRYVHGQDWVPTVPPAFLGYVHGGALHRIEATQPRQIFESWRRSATDTLAAIQDMAQRRRLDTGRLPVTVAGLADHAPAFYAALLWNELLSNDSTGSA